jgi:hypothetical protein
LRDREAEIHEELRTREAEPVNATGEEGPRPDFWWVNSGSLEDAFPGDIRGDFWRFFVGFPVDFHGKSSR